MATAEEVKPEKEKAADKEGRNLLGPPTCKELENGRFKCIETGHEMPAKDIESYGQCKRCRLGLIDASLSQKKPPLNMFKQDPLSRSKIICKLTGDTINKSEEHIWKHISGKRFLNKVEQKEAEKLTLDGEVIEQDEQVPHKKSELSADGMKKKKEKKKKKKEKEDSEIISEVRESFNKDSDSEETDFWMPPVGSRWNFDDGGDRWGSGSESGQETDEDGADEEGANESTELSMRTKRMSIEIGPSSFASRNKKSKTDPTS